MKELTAEERKRVQLDILKYLRDLCEKLNLHYYLMGGTLLGAVRHKGFIPWDDDIDVMMPREDYDVLIKYFNNNNTGKYRLADWSIDSTYFFPMGKLMDTTTFLISDSVKTCKDPGAFIDIMPADHIVDGEDLRNRRAELGKCGTIIEIFGRMLPQDYQKLKAGWNFKEKLMYSFYRLKGLKYYIQRYDDICKRYNNVKTNYRATLAWIYYDREFYDDNVLGEGSKVFFEDDWFNAPKDWNRFLTTVYGDYMQLPPEEKRISGHSFKIYWKK